MKKLQCKRFLKRKLFLRVCDFMSTAQLPLEDRAYLWLKKAYREDIPLNPDGSIADQAKASPDYMGFISGFLNRRGTEVSSQMKDLTREGRARYGIYYKTASGSRDWFIENL